MQWVNIFSFVRNFRLNKEAFNYVLDNIRSKLPTSLRSTSVTPIVKLELNLSFLGKVGTNTVCWIGTTNCVKVYKRNVHRYRRGVVPKAHKFHHESRRKTCGKKLLLCHVWNSRDNRSCWWYPHPNGQYTIAPCFVNISSVILDMRSHNAYKSSEWLLWGSITRLSHMEPIRWAPIYEERLCKWRQVVVVNR